MTDRIVALAPLSLLHMAPDEFVYTAAEAGFGGVGFRTRAVTRNEPAYDLSPGSALSRRVLSGLRETGLEVLDAEFLLLDGSLGAEQWRPALDAAQALGARYFTVAAADTEPRRLEETLEALSQDAGERGIDVALEPISYQAIRTLTQAVELAERLDLKVLPDCLHLLRAYQVPAVIEEVASRLVPLVSMVQLCDGPAVPPPDREGLLYESRAERMAPGTGAFRTEELLSVLPDELPVSVEAPHPDSSRMGPGAYARTLFASVQRLL